jgi:hypothetical protein
MANFVYGPLGNPNSDGRPSLVEVKNLDLLGKWLYKLLTEHGV